MYSSGALSAPGLPNATFDVVCQNPQAQLDQAVREGAIRARAVNGLEVREIDTAVWRGLKLNKKSMAFQNGELVALEVLFDAAEVTRHWSTASEAMAQRDGTEAGALAWLKSKMAEGPKRSGVTKASLLIESRIGVGPRAWARAYTDAAKSADPSWRAPGPAKRIRSSRR
jgi:hypothetical protein